LCGEKAVTLHKLSEELGVSAERIRQIEVKALQDSHDDGTSFMNISHPLAEQATTSE